VNGARQRFAGAVKNVEGTVERWLKSGYTAN
jgi:hypothetical protein